MSDKTATFIIAIVTAVWAANIVAGMLRWNDYAPSESVNGIFMVIVGGTFAARARGKGGKQQQKEQEPVHQCISRTCWSVLECLLFNMRAARHDGAT